MTSIQIAAARQVLGLVGRTRASVPFFYCAAGAAGAPLLLVDAESIPAAVRRDAILSARRKVFVQGRVERAGAGGTLVFRAQDASGTDQLITDLDGILDEMIPGLRFARVDLLVEEDAG